MDGHTTRVQSISNQVRSFHERRQPFRIYHGSTSTTRKTTLSRSNVVDTSQMTNVIRIEPEKRMIAVEPNVSMAQLVDATLEHNLLPPVVMEFPSITVGGGFAGTSGESSSFKYGVFDRTISKVEIVLADGEVVSASQHERADLFNAAAGTFGTFGVITMLEIPLIEARSLVKLTYSPVTSMDGAISTIEQLIVDRDIDYVEGIMFGSKSGVIISGKLTDVRDPKLRCTRYTRPSDPWFYLHAQDILKRAPTTPTEELVPIKDYLFRYDRAAFWAGMWGFKYFRVPFNSLTRRALNFLLHTKTMYHAMHKSHIADQYVVQDIGFPHSTVGHFTDYVQDRLGLHPLWLCPLKMTDDISLRPRNTAAYMQDSRCPGSMINIGLWGPGARKYDDFIELNREIERKTAELGGLKCFYAQAFYKPDEFWALYDKEWYDDIRTRYKATGLPSVYDKVNAAWLQWKPEKDQTRKERLRAKLRRQRPWNGVYGVFHTMLRREYLF